MLTPKEIAYEVTKALDAKKGQNIKLLKIDRVSSLADYFLICTGTSNTHVKTLCDYAEYTLEQLGEQMLSREGPPGQFLGAAGLRQHCRPRFYRGSPEVLRSGTPVGGRGTCGYPGYRHRRELVYIRLTEMQPV